MKRFHFKLEAILKMRKLKEDQCKMEIGRIQGRINLLNGYKQSEQAGIAQAYISQEEGLKRGMSGQEAQFHPYYVSGKKARIEQIESEVKMYEMELAEKYKELAKLRGEVKVMQKMKEKEQKAFKKEMNKKQFAQIEEQIQNWKQCVGENES